MKNIFWLLALTFTFAPAYAAKDSIFSKIPDEAQVGNGSAEITKYNAQLTKKELEELGKKELKKEYWKKCGPWKVLTGRREIMKKIEDVENLADKNSVAKTLHDLYDNDKIVAMVGAISNNEIECSLSWFNVYGSDGTVLELRYNMGD